MDDRCSCVSPSWNDPNGSVCSFCEDRSWEEERQKERDAMDEAIELLRRDGYGDAADDLMTSMMTARLADRQLDYALGLLASLREETTPVRGETGALCSAIDDFIRTGEVPSNVKAA